MSGRWELPAGGPAVLRSAVPATSQGPRPALFLDRDGTLNAAVADPQTGLPESPLSADRVRLLPGVGTALRRAQDAGHALVCVSNQPAAAKGKTTLPEILAIHERVLGLLAGEGVEIELSLLCPHHPDGTVEGLTIRCGCRKPEPGMLQLAAASIALDLPGSWMIGDTDSDVAAGRAAGVRTALIDYAETAHKRSGAAVPDVGAPDLDTAVGAALDPHRV